MTLVVVMVASCSSSHSGESLTPRITDPNSSGSPLNDMLLTTADLRSISGLPADMQAVSVNDLSLFADPDPRGPCGAKVQQPDLGGGAGTGIQSPSLQGAEFVVPLEESVARAYLSALIADTRAGCASHTSLTNNGTQQSVELLHVVGLPDLADQQTATVLGITNQGQRFEGAEVVLRKGGTIAFVVVFGVTAPSDSIIVAIAQKAADRLTG